MLTREQSVNLRVGQVVRVKTLLASNVFGTIKSVHVPAAGARVIEVHDLRADGKPWAIGSIFVTCHDIEMV